MGNILRYSTTILILLGIAPMPDIYYAVMGYTVSMLFVLIAATDIKSGNIIGVFLCLALAGVYQPFYPIEMSNVLWIVVYSVSALWLLVEIAFIANQKLRKEFWDKRQREREYQSSTFDED